MGHRVFPCSGLKGKEYLQDKAIGLHLDANLIESSALQAAAIPPIVVQEG